MDNTLAIERIKQMGNNEECQVCGFNEAVDLHHDREKDWKTKKQHQTRLSVCYDVYLLCPNHHALITRRIKTIRDYKIQPLKIKPMSKKKRMLNLRDEGLTYQRIAEIITKEYSQVSRQRVHQIINTTDAVKKHKKPLEMPQSITFTNIARREIK